MGSPLLLPCLAALYSPLARCMVPPADILCKLSTAGGREQSSDQAASVDRRQRAERQRAPLSSGMPGGAWRIEIPDMRAACAACRSVLSRSSVAHAPRPASLLQQARPAAACFTRQSISRPSISRRASSAAAAAAAAGGAMGGPPTAADTAVAESLLDYINASVTVSRGGAAASSSAATPRGGAACCRSRSPPPLSTAPRGRIHPCLHRPPSIAPPSTRSSTPWMRPPSACCRRAGCS